MIRCIKQMYYLHLLLTFGLLLAVMIMLFSTIRRALRRQIEFFWGTLGVLCTALVLFFCIIASAAGTIVFLPADPPKEAAVRYVEACFDEARKDGAVSGNVVFPTELKEAFRVENDTDALLVDALQDSLSYRLLGDIRVQGRNAGQDMEVRYLDLKKLPLKIRPLVEQHLAGMAEEKRREEIYDAHKAYRAEVLEEAYALAVGDILRQAEQYYTTEQLTLRLTYENGCWNVQQNEGLMAALYGGLVSPETYANNARSEALSGLAYIPKHFMIPEEALAAPPPNAAKYGATRDVGEISALYEAHAELTEGRSLFWDENADFRGGDFRYYADDTILAVAWKELVNGKYCAFAEVFIADPSQFRRKIAADTFGSGIQKTASQLSAECNAVIAMNGDYYKYRTEGVMVYQRHPYRFRPYRLELCHVNAAGDLLFTYAGELETEEALEQYIREQDILFTLSFGPVLVANGEIHQSDVNYLLGQVNQNYSRSAIGQCGRGHYLLMNLNYGYGSNGSTVSEEAQIMYRKGCENAYALDGGQTAEIIVQNRVFNAIDYGNERMVSDIIYFATALPEEENQ